MSFKINASLRDAVQKTFIKLFKNDGKDYVTITVALSPETIKWIVEVSKSLEDREYVTLRGNVFPSGDGKESVYDGVVKPHRVGSEKVDYVG